MRQRDEMFRVRGGDTLWLRGVTSHSILAYSGCFPGALKSFSFLNTISSGATPCRTATETVRQYLGSASLLQWCCCSQTVFCARGAGAIEGATCKRLTYRSVQGLDGAWGPRKLSVLILEKVRVRGELFISDEALQHHIAVLTSASKFSRETSYDTR